MVTFLLSAVIALSARHVRGAESVALFNGKDLSGWHVYTVQTKNENPGIFTAVDGMLKISGGAGDVAYLGGIITEGEYENYRLKLEYKWGGPTYGARQDAARDSGILVHCVGPEGPGPWRTSIECQIIEGGTGDIILIGGNGDDGKPVPMAATIEAVKREGQYYFHPGGPKVTANSGRLNWYGRDLAWKDVKDFRGKEDVESPFGEWTCVECICKNHELTNIVNGKVVNHVTGLPLNKGKILIQTEGAEMWVRNIELTPLDP
ncbi:MAG: DUF1080 domain-containing protein [Planctomycetota bacterium]